MRIFSFWVEEQEYQSGIRYIKLGIRWPAFSSRLCHWLCNFGQGLYLLWALVSSSVNLENLTKPTLKCVSALMLWFQGIVTAFQGIMFKEPKSGRLDSRPKTCTCHWMGKVMEWPGSSVGNTRVFLEGRESDGLTEDRRGGDFRNGVLLYQVPCGKVASVKSELLVFRFYLFRL